MKSRILAISAMLAGAMLAGAMLTGCERDYMSERGFALPEGGCPRTEMVIGFGVKDALVHRKKSEVAAATRKSGSRRRVAACFRSQFAKTLRTLPRVEY